MDKESFDNDNTQTHLALTAGTAVSHYRIISKIGAGGMGEVYLAEDTKLKREVALKFLPTHFCQDEDCRARFKREAQAAAQLKHPNIVTIYEVSEHQGRPFFAMEHCEGQTLGEMIASEELSIGKVISLATQICEGLVEAHSSGITHRDIKPSNIILDKDMRPKLVDFGLAAIEGTDKLTKTGSTLGTVGYMSPEQIQVHEVDQRSDLFSFGVVLYQMIAGRIPFKGDNEAATLNSILNDTPEPMSRYKSGVTGELQRIVSKLLEKDPQLRYQSAAGVISDLKRLTAPESAVSVQPVRKDWWNRFIVSGAAIVLLVLAGYWLIPKYVGVQPDDETSGRKMLAVLPFENLGAPEDEYFADGITDEITSRLAAVHSLGVISRTSAFSYKNTTKSLPQIAKELGVDYILEGTIRWDKSGAVNRIRVTPQLIGVSDDTHLWADNYERELEDIFAVQADIATRIAEALDVTLLESERQLLSTKPTDNTVAYDFYLRGKQYWDQGKNSESAIQMFENAIALDSSFYPAYAWLPRVYGFEYINDIRMTDERKEQAREAAEMAFQLAHGKPDGYMAMGYYHYYFSRDYDRALELFEHALEGQPNNSELIAATAYVKRRMGDWDGAVAGLQKALSLNPFSPSEIDGLARTLIRLHRIDDAQAVVDEALKFAPDNAGLLLWNAAIAFYSGKDTSHVQAAIREFERWTTASAIATLLLLRADILSRDYQSALRRLTSPRGQTSSDSVTLYAETGRIYRFMGDSSLTRTYFDSALTICEERVRNNPEVALFHSGLAIALAGVGQNLRAVQEGELAAEILPISRDELSGPIIIEMLAEVYTMVGEYDLAIEKLDYLLSHPSQLQIQAVRYDPIWDSLRDQPRFKALLEKYDTR